LKEASMLELQLQPLLPLKHTGFSTSQQLLI